VDLFSELSLEDDLHFVAPKIPRQKVHQYLQLGILALLTPFTLRGTRLKEAANDK